MWDWEDFSTDSAVEDTALLISLRTQSLAISALRQMQFRNQWDDIGAWDDIESALSNALTELMSVQMPDFTPVGTVSAYVGSVAPDKWLLCDGDLYDGSDYPELFAVIDAAFIAGDDFRTPDLQDRFIFGRGINDDIGDLGGANQHILTIAEMPSHNHAERSNLGVGVIEGIGRRTDGVSSTVTTATTTTSTGGGAAHNNMPAYLALNYIIKALP